MATKKIGSFFRLFSVIAVLCFALGQSYGQVDTLVVYDTIYQAKEPVIITHKVYQKGLKRDRNKHNWYINAQYMAGHSFYKGDTRPTDGTWHSLGLEIGGRLWKNIELGIGFSGQTINDNFAIQDTAYSYLHHKEVRYDTLGRYIDVINGVPVTKYALREHVNDRLEILPSVYQKKAAQQIKYYEIPLKLAYAHIRPKYIFRPYVIFTYSFVAKQKEDEYHISYQSCIGKYGIGMEFNYLFYSRLALNATIQYTNNFSSVLSDASLVRQQWAVGFGVKYFL